MSHYYGILVLANEDDWVRHASQIVQNRQGRTDDELLADICDFDMQFGVIPR